MGTSRGSVATSVTRSSSRGQSTVLGIVLLIGIVAIGSLSLFLVAGEMIDSAEQQSEQERIEQAFVELSSSVSSSTSAADVSQSMELHAGERGAIAHHDSATYEIWTESYSGDKTPVASGSIGTIEYEDDDGTTIAYEGDGVFHERGEQTQVLSAPPLDYDHGTNTLSFPVVTLTEEKTIHSGDVRIEQTDVDRESTNYVQDDHVFVEIESEYCRGWEEYFTEQAGDATLQEACYGGENDDGKVKVRLGYDDIDNAFTSGVSIGDRDNYDEHQSGAEIDELSEGDFRPLNDVIDNMVDDFKGNESDLTEEDLDSIGGGKYFAGEGALDGEEELSFDLEDENAIVVIDDDIAGYDVTVNCNDGDSEVKIYSTGNLDLSADNSAFDQNCDSDITRLQVYGKSTMAINLQNGDFEGLLYAASDEDLSGDFAGWETDSSENDDPDYQIHVGGSAEFEGSIVAHSIQEQNNLGGDDDFDTYGIGDREVDIIPVEYRLAPQLTYLNLAEHEIDIKNE